MKRTEANSGHHPNKVVLTNQATDSNNRINLSSSNLNNNTVSNKQHQLASLNPNQTHGSQACTSLVPSSAVTSDVNKEANFEYDDNEWDIGIGDLIIDLDADIEKSSFTVSNSQQHTQSSLAGTSEYSETSVSSRNCDHIGQPSKVTSAYSSEKPFISVNTQSKGETVSSTSSKHHSSSFSSLPFAAEYHHQKSSVSESANRSVLNLSKHSLLISQLNSSKHHELTPLISSEKSGIKHSKTDTNFNNSISCGLDLDSSESNRTSSLTTMSSTTGTSGGKSATKLAVDHQATLDKGLKMKIKRTKPGSKSSEAKHEIVKAEQNGTGSLTSSNVDENNSGSNISSNTSNKKHSSQSQSQTQQVPSSNMSQQQTQQQGTKRGSSGHRRDKAKEKTTHHNQRDKNEHNNSSSASVNSASSGSDRGGCSCTHEMQVNGISQPCSSMSCVRNRTNDQSISSLSQRLSNQNSSTSTSNNLFSSNSNTGSSLSSSNNTPNAPGPPSSKDGNKSKPVVPIIIHSSSQITSTATANSSQLSNLQHSASPSGSNSGSGINTNTATNNTNTSSCSSSSTNNVLKSQLQSTAPTSLLNALSSGTTATSSILPSSSSSSSSTSSSLLSSTGDSNTLLVQEDKRSTSPPPAKRHKCDPKDMIDVCVGTSVGTITEPDCLGPCEPGTSVTLEGIVWHETEGGVLVVNVTWRGKTYVGTLIDCTKHDWAPPRFCDSPTEEFDSRTPKGRAKRVRNSTLFPVNDLSNFTETRSSMHSKLRNGGSKGRGGRGTSTTAETSSSKTTTTTTTTTASSSSSTSTSISSNTPSTSPVAFLPPRSEKRKSKDEPPSPVSATTSATTNTSGSVINSSSVSNANASGIVNSNTLTTQSVVNPMTGLNVQISTKKCKSTASPCAVSPVLLECPEQDCSKKYKHANGLRYHQSHAHGSVSSMDEDSSHQPESPQRVAPPTTPSPLPVVQTSISTVTTTPSCLAPSTTTSPAITSNSSNAVTHTTSQSATMATATTNATSVTISNVTSNTASQNNLLMTVNVSTGPSTMASQSLLTTTTPSLPLTSQVTSQSTISSPVAAGGSITTGIAGQSQTHTLMGNTSTLLSTALAGGSATTGPPSSHPPQSPLNQVQIQSSQQHPQQSSNIQVTNSTIPTTPTRCDAANPKNKSSVLRFGPLPAETDHARLTPVSQSSSNPPGSIPPSIQQTPPMRPTTVGVTGGILTLQPATTGTTEAIGLKSQNCPKQKKTRKSPGPSEFDVAASNRAEDVQSPAYSDISDDSTPVVDPNDLDKAKASQLPDATKKPNENVTGPLGPLSGYGMYQYYPGMPHQPTYYSAEHSGKAQGLGHSPLGPNTTIDYKNKEPPLDLMNKTNQHQQQQPPSQPGQPPHPPHLTSTEPGPQMNKDSSPMGASPHPGTGKMMQHFYPYGYMPAGFSYNLEPNYGPVSMISDDNKLSQQQQPSGQIKEERIKESPSPNEYAKMGPQIVPSKLIKSEPIAIKDLKTESSHSLHGKDQNQPVQQPGQPSLTPYSGMFQRHGLNVGPPTQPPQHINREEDLRRLFNYSDQRRSSTSSNSSTSNLNTKDEPPSPSQSNSAHLGQTPPHAQSTTQTASNSSQSLSQPQQKGQKNTSSSQATMKQQKDIKSEDKELLKVKQEGQKPTMETQGPPPPPTSQYYPHSLYMSAAPFGFDPNHQMYRNMLVPTPSYSATPYHLQIPRYTSPEDLSRNSAPKALELLQHHAQYYNTHKIHELREGALKSPTSNVKVSVSSPNLSQQSSQNPNICIPPSNSNITGTGMLQQQAPQQQQPPPVAHPQPSQPGGPLQPSSGGGPGGGNLGTGGGSTGSELQKDPVGPGILSQGPPSQVGPPQPGQPPSGARSPPPQRHVHTHHHTHVGLGYPMFQAPYGAVLASQQAAAAVTVISPFQTGPPAK